MPKKFRTDRRAPGLEDKYAVANAYFIGASLLGRREPGEDVDNARAMWRRHQRKLVQMWIGGWRSQTKFVWGEAAVATGTPGTRPPAWWSLVVRARMPPTPAAQAAYLRRCGLLAAGEEKLIEQHARRAAMVAGLLEGDGGGG